MTFTYKNYCWSLGTTSFRTENFNRTIELQLNYLNEFWSLENNIDEKWNGNPQLQSRYYDFLKSKYFVDGNAKNKPKDAREKTSGLVDLGLIGDNRRLTEVGFKILEISKANDFSIDNFLNISKDSFLYLKQLLKMSIKNDEGAVRPFIVLIYFLTKFNTIPMNIFTYLIPLCTSKEHMFSICKDLELYNDNKISIDRIIINRLKTMSNYQEALKYFLSMDKINVDIICAIGLNRKSKNYDIPYFELYETLKSIILYHKQDKIYIIKLLEVIKTIKIKNKWIKYIFIGKQQITNKYIEKKLMECLNTKKPIFQAKNEKDFKEEFFWLMHLLKAKATLSDYADLNKRYFGLSDIFLFKDNKVELDIIPKHFFKLVIEKLEQEAFMANNMLVNNCMLNEINSYLISDEALIINSINENLGLDIHTLDEAKQELENQRTKRFNTLIDEKFTDEAIITLLNHFENRNDDYIKSYITNNADIPTIFEYVLGIVWYKISERKGKILEYMKLSLDANLLPKSHAAGGDADIVYEYDKTTTYPKHILLLEATLSDKTNQRRMELEPISRHLGQHLLKNNNTNSYCVFITTYLDINVLSDFRYRKDFPYYDTNNSQKYIKGMKIIPLSTDILKNIIKKNKKYKELYEIFENAHKIELSIQPNAIEWHKNNIMEKI